MFDAFRKNLAAWAFVGMAGFAKAVPLRWGQRIARWIGLIYAQFPHHQKRGLEYNLSHLLGYTGRKKTEIRNQIFENFALTLYDFFAPSGVTIEVPERAKLESVRKKHGGILVLTFHMGHWELGARSMAEWGWPVTAVYQPYRNKKLKRVIEAHRAPGVRFIPVGAGAAQGVQESLRRGDVVAMLGDHPFGEDGSPVPLLHHRVLWPRGPVVLAVRAKAPIVIAVIVRHGHRRYVAHIEDPLVPNDGSKGEVDRLVGAIAFKFGKLLTHHVTQWYRFQPFDFVE